eukprot:ANDGO_01042.mRNA.1 hypothetical protein
MTSVLTTPFRLFRSREAGFKNKIAEVLQEIRHNHQQGLRFSKRQQMYLQFARRTKTRLIWFCVLISLYIGVAFRFPAFRLAHNQMVYASYILLPGVLAWIALIRVLRWQARRCGRKCEKLIAEAKTQFDSNFSALGMSYDEYVLKQESAAATNDSVSQHNGIPGTPATARKAKSVVSPTPSKVRLPVTSPSSPAVSIPAMPASAVKSELLSTPISQSGSRIAGRSHASNASEALSASAAPTAAVPVAEAARTAATAEKQKEGWFGKLIGLAVGIDESTIVDAFCQACGQHNGRVLHHTIFECRKCHRRNRFENGEFRVELSPPNSAPMQLNASGPNSQASNPATTGPAESKKDK